ncbi:hypothetical protein ACHAXS_009870 [Conticribra weissflogii]
MIQFLLDLVEFPISEIDFPLQLSLHIQIQLRLFRGSFSVICQIRIIGSAVFQTRYILVVVVVVSRTVV